MTSRRELKNYAKQAMSGKYGILILAFVAVQALALISSMISTALFPGEETIDIVLSYAFTFILTLLINVVAAGMNYMYLNIARGKAYSLNDLFYFYRHHPDRVIVAGFFMAVLNLLTMLPYTIYSNANLPGKDASVEALITWLYTGVVLMIVGMIVYQILVIPLEMTYYILADKPELKSTEAMKESLEMMHGNFGRYLMLKISFIPLMFLSVFTFYIALLWIFPYMAMTEVMFYRDLTGELKVQKEEEERMARDYVNPMFDSYSRNEQPQEDQTHPQHFGNVTGESSTVYYENNKDNEVITVHIDYNKTDSQEIKFKNEENKKRLLYLLEYIKEEGIYKKIDNIDMTKPNSINMGTKEDINILLNSDEELKYNISRLAMILADLQNKKQKGGEIDLSTGKYALYRP